ncbi:MAG: class I SAM-dependent methyltransferase [Streptosporangiaceae bacterium]
MNAPGSRLSTSGQRARWERAYAATPARYGPRPSRPGRYAAGLFRHNGVRQILELGAGHGRDTLTFLDAGFTVHALDFAAPAITELRDAAMAAGTAGRLSAATHDVRERLPLPDASTDAVYSHLLMSMALSTAELTALAGEIRRVLRPGGWHVYTARNIHDPDYASGTAHGDGLFDDGTFIVHFFDHALVERLAAGMRLLDITELDEGELPRRLWQLTLRKT